MTQQSQMEKEEANPVEERVVEKIIEKTDIEKSRSASVANGN